MPGRAVEQARTMYVRRRDQVIRKPGHRQPSLAAERTCSAPSRIDLPVLRRRVARHLDVDGRTLAALAALTQAEEGLHLLPRERLALVRVARALGRAARAG